MGTIVGIGGTPSGRIAGLKARVSLIKRHEVNWVNRAELNGIRSRVWKGTREGCDSGTFDCHFNKEIF